ncbi:hypothetical protein KXV85_009812 [Aspergillus fumigatus]|nr:hypothetical protein KXV85_009812 [Aspergillus fumigatus]KAH2864629.1 hypothetical protein KXV67_007820 [Aspergillus fumigatus]
MASHPLQAIGEAVGAAGADPRPMQLSSLFQGANDGPAKTAAKLTGVQAAGKRADDGPYFTNNEAIPFPDPAHSKTAGGIPVASDTFLFQKQQHFNRSKPLERMVHPCGSGAFGYFETTKDVSSLTKAHFLRSVGVRTPVFARFSTVTLGREFPDEARNPRGFAVKFYTGEGNYDIVGLNFPVFFCRDPIQGPDVIRSQYRNPQNFLLDHNSLFDLLANTPEGNHAGMMFFSDHGTPVGWRNLHGYGCHTFKVNKRGEFVYIKYHFIADRGQKQSTADEAIQMCGEDPDFLKLDLYQAIEKGEKISWTAHVQIMKPEEADPTKLGFDPFDVTKLHEFGKLVLNKNPENFHRDVEQAAFSPGSMVPGIEDSPDPLLQFRMFFYRDAQYHRIGVNLHQIPVNCPFMASSYSSLNFDGPLRVDANHAMNPQYAPNSFVHKFRPDTAEAPYQLADNTVSRKSHFYHEGKLSEYDQPRALYQKVMDARGREHLHCNTARMLKVVEYPEIQLRYLTQLYCIAPEYARGVYDLLPEQKFDFSQVKAQAQGAERVGKEAKFRPSKDTDILAGKCPATPVYNQ